MKLHFIFNDLPADLPKGVEILFDETGKKRTYTNILSGRPHEEPLYNAHTSGLAKFGITEFQINNVPRFVGEQTLGVVSHSLFKNYKQPHNGDIISAGYVRHTCVKENNYLMRLAWMGN